MSGIAKSTLNFLSISVCGFKNGFVFLALMESHTTVHFKASGTIFFLGHIYKTNLEMRSVTISWLIGGCGKYRIAASGTYFPTVCNAPNLAINVYIDSSPAANFSYDPALHPKQADGNLILSVARCMLYTMFTELPFPTTHEADATATLNATIVPARTATIRLARTELAKAFALVLFAVNWAFVLAVVYLTIVVAVSPTAVGLEGILFVPLTVRYAALSSCYNYFVRSHVEFAARMLFDILGLFMQMALVSLCSIVATLRVVPRPHTPT
ncbi:hypothetical protein C8R43DRAFT_1235503 [Mycena crocata]|nr:hypothetical protein C8R43DRAFT_1235503 [Mycena crocata]